MKNTKKFILWLVATALLCSIICYGMMKEDQQTTEDIELQSINADVNVSNGIAQPESIVRDIRILEDSAVVFQINCKPDHEGLITGCMIYDEQEEIVFSCSGEEWTAESSKLNLKAGTYTVEFYYLTNENVYEKFWKDAGKEISKDVEDLFQDSGKWDVRLEYGYGEVKGGSLEYYLGMVIGIAAGLAFAVFLKWIIQKMGGKVEVDGRKCKESYDERQLLARGQAYKTAFFTLLFYICIVAVISEFSEIPLLMSFAGIWVGICLSVAVFAIVCILKDAYMSLYENTRGLIMMFSVMGILNTGIGVLRFYQKRPMIEDGMLSIDCINLIVGIMFLIILVVFCGKLLYDKRNAKEEE